MVVHCESPKIPLHSMVNTQSELTTRSVYEVVREKKKLISVDIGTRAIIDKSGYRR